MIKKKTNTTTNTIVFVVAGMLLASFMGTMGLMTSSSSVQTAVADHGYGGEQDKTIFMMTEDTCSTTAECDDLVSRINARGPDSDDKLIFHFGPGTIPQSGGNSWDVAIAALGEVNGPTTVNRGVEFSSLDELLVWADDLDA